MTKKELAAKRRDLWNKLLVLKASHGRVQQTGFSIRTGSAGCGLTSEEISARCATIRVQIEGVRAELAALA